MEIRIDSEFHSLIPPLSSDEKRQLEENLKRDGCLDPLKVWNEILIDGHNRYEICEREGIEYDVEEIKLSDRDAAKVWIIRNQFGRRNLTTYARGELVLKLEPLIAAKAKEHQKKSGGPVPKKSAEPPIETRKEIAKAAGVSHDTIAKVKFIRDHADEATKAQLRTDPNIKVHRVAKDLRESKQKAARQANRMEAVKDAPPMDERIIIGDFRKHADKVADGSVNLIFTDPPYDREASKMLPDLAAFAASKLCDGGSLICYVGQTQLPAAMDALRKSLRYWWTIACVHAGRSTVMREYGVNAGWKAVLWFVKGTRHDNSIMVRDVMSGGEEKQSHDWQQAQSEAEYWIDKLCPQDGLVCDPFLGGGTTAAAAKVLNRQWIGFEVSDDTARIASGRIAG